MASTALTIRDTFSVGMFGGNKKDSGAGGTGVIGALGKIQGTLNTLVGLTKESLSIQRGEKIVSQREQLASSLTGAEADPEPIPKGEGSGFMSGGWDKLKGALGKARQSPSLMLAVLLGGLALLSRYSEHLVGPLAKLLEWFDKNGLPGIEKVLLKVKDWTVDKVLITLESIKTFFAKFKKDGEYRLKIEELVVTIQNIFEEIGKVFEFLEKKYQGFKKFISKWDKEAGTDEAGTGVMGLDPDEWDQMMKDMATAAGKFVADMFVGLIKSIGGVILGTAFMGIAFSMGKKAILASGLFGGATTTAATVGPKMPFLTKISTMKLGAGGVIALGLMAANAVIETVAASQRAFGVALDEETGRIDKSKFASSWLAGGAKGGWANAFANLKEKAGIGGGIGMAAGIPFGPGGMLLGGLIGMMVGGLIGTVTGWFGSDRMDKFFTDIGESIWSVLSTIGNFFKSVWRGLKNMATGGSFMDAYNMTDLEIDVKNLKEMEKEVGISKSMTQETALAALGPAPSAEKVKGGLKNTQWVHTKEYLEYQQKVKAINDLFELRASVAADSQALPGIIQEQIDLAEASLVGLEAAGPGQGGLTTKAAHNAKITGIKKDIEQLKKDLVIAKNMAIGVFEDPTAPSNILTLDRQKRLLSLYPPKIEPHKGSIKENNEEIKYPIGSTEWMMMNAANPDAAQILQDNKTIVHAKGGDATYTGSVEVIDTNGTAASLGNANGADLAVPLSLGFRRSDIQLKEDIKLEGKSPSDINIYSFKYKGEEGRYEGVMAQEVPWASVVGDNGYLMVDYSKLDVEFKKLN